MNIAVDPVKTPVPKILDRIGTYVPELVSIRHDLHQHPEIGFEEVRTSGIVAEKLVSWGIEVHRGYGKTGVVGVLHGRQAGNRSIGLRADMDALPMPEETGLPYASVYPASSTVAGMMCTPPYCSALPAIWRKPVILPAR